MTTTATKSASSTKRTAKEKQRKRGRYFEETKRASSSQPTMEIFQMIRIPFEPHTPWGCVYAQFEVYCLCRHISATAMKGWKPLEEKKKQNNENFNHKKGTANKQRPHELTEKPFLFRWFHYFAYARERERKRGGKFIFVCFFPGVFLFQEWRNWQP